MAHHAPPSASPHGPHRRLELFFGLLLLIVGVAVAAVAVTALNHPHGRQAANVVVGTASPSRTGTTAAPGSKASSSRASVSPIPRPPASTTPASGTPVTTPAGSGRLPLVVLNNTSQDSILTTATARFRAGGWSISGTSTFDGSILSTVAYYDPDVAGAQSAALALQQQFPAIKRVKAKFDGLPAGPIVVVVTSDYS